MGELREVPTPSTVNIMQHPVHPTMVVFPISFLMGTFAGDVVYLLTDDPFWPAPTSSSIGCADGRGTSPLK